MSDFSCLADMEDDNLLLNIVSQPAQAKPKSLGQKAAVGVDDLLSFVLISWKKIVIVFCRNGNMRL